MDTLDRALPQFDTELPPVGTQRMYAIAFDLDAERLSQTYPGTSWNNAYRDVRLALDEHGFAWRQGSVYFGDRSVTPVTCVLAVQDLTARFAWFTTCARDIRMLRIEANDDLRPAIDAIAANG